MKLVYQGDLILENALAMYVNYICRRWPVKPSTSVLANGKEVPLSKSYTILNLIDDPPWVVAEETKCE